MVDEAYIAKHVENLEGVAVDSPYAGDWKLAEVQLSLLSTLYSLLSLSLSAFNRNCFIDD
jgi:hypothetical protein